MNEQQLAEGSGRSSDAGLMEFRGILFPGPGALIPSQRETPDSFRDLNLDQIVASVTGG